MNLQREAATPAQSGDAEHRVATPEVFSAAEKEQFALAPKVWVLAYSSTGGGHTARSLDPMVAAVDRGVIGPGELVCVSLPEQWPHDKGAAEKTLNKYLNLFASKGVNVIVTQGDKTITGLYTKQGSADNPAILENFVEKAKRDTPTPTVNTILHGPGKGFSANAIMKQMVHAAGDPDKFHVLSDMGVYAVKGALAAGIPARQIIEMGNHATLLDMSHGAKHPAYLSKATAEGRPGKFGVIEYHGNTNPLVSMRQTLTQLGVTPETPVKAVHEKAVEYLLTHAKRNNLDPAATTTAGIIVADGKEAKDLDGACYLYVSEYTQIVGTRIKEQLRDQNPAFEKTLFVVCGAGAFHGGVAGNPLHMMYAAHADGVMNAGYGTTSEIHYLLDNGFQGKLLLMPVEHQHEQEANGATMKRLLGDKIQVAGDRASLFKELDRMVQNRTTTAQLAGHMGSIVHAVDNGRTHTGHIVDLMAGGAMTPREAQLLALGKTLAESPDTKSMRRLGKVIVPALQAAIAGRDTIEIKPSSKHATMRYDMSSLIASMKDDAQFGMLLGGSDIHGAETRKFRAECVATLEQLAALPPDQRKAFAEQCRTALGERFVLGY
jgi:hypothetical protein